MTNMKQSIESGDLSHVQALIEAGVDIDDAYAKSGDTYLIAAASLCADLGTCRA
ncbi:MAG: hypothetical protein ACJA2W_001973 [Planctomycetota bacterium]|jgi:hypothetical protein